MKSGDKGLPEKDREFLDDYKAAFVKNISSAAPARELLNTYETAAARFYEETFTGQSSGEPGVSIPAEHWNCMEAALHKGFLLMARAYINYLLSENRDSTGLKPLADLAAARLSSLDSLYRQTMAAVAKKEPLPEFREIMKGFEHIKKAGTELKLFNSFKGITISFNAAILAIDENSVRLDLHKYQALAILSEELTIIKSPAFPKAVIATALETDVTRHFTVLAGFGYVTASLAERRFVRVEPESPTEAVISAGSTKITGQILELSSGGLSASAADPKALAPGLPVTIQMRLPDLIQKSFVELNVNSKVMAVTKAKTVYRVSIKFYPDRFSEELIQQYIVQRQISIINNLKHAVSFCK